MGTGFREISNFTLVYALGHERFDTGPVPEKGHYFRPFLPPASAVEVIESVPSVGCGMSVCLCVSYHSHG